MNPALFVVQFGGDLALLAPVLKGQLPGHEVTITDMNGWLDPGRPPRTPDILVVSYEAIAQAIGSGILWDRTLLPPETLVVYVVPRTATRLESLHLKPREILTLSYGNEAFVFGEDPIAAGEEIGRLESIFRAFSTR